MESLAPVDPLFHAKSFENQVTAIRETTKWHALALAAIIGVLLGGIKLTDFSKLGPFLMIIFLLVSSVGFIIVSLAVIACSQVLSLRRPSLKELLKDENLRQRVESGPTLLLSHYKNVKTLDECYTFESESYARQYLLTYDAAFIEIKELSKEFKHNIEHERLLQCRLAAYEVLAYAHLVKVQRTYALCQIVLGVGFFAILFICTLIGMLLGTVS